MQFNSIIERWGVRPPDLFDEIEMIGLVSNDEAGIRLSRFRWLSSAEIAHEQWLIPHIPQLVPFARTPGRDHFAWFYGNDGNPCVADCPRDSKFATGFAPSFDGFLYRAVLEEMTGSWLEEILKIDAETLQERIISYIERLRPFLADHWIQTLSTKAKQNWWRTSDGSVAAIHAAELMSIVHRDLGFLWLDEEFIQLAE